jgi:hypothetical protein
MVILCPMVWRGGMMRAGLFCLSDELWSLIEPHLPRGLTGPEREDDLRFSSFHCMLVLLPQDFRGALRKRHLVLPGRLHACFWDGPDALREVDFVPGRLQYFAGPAGRQDRELQRPCDYSPTALQIGHERRHVVIWQGRMMTPGEPLALGQQLIEMTALARRVLAAAFSLVLAASSTLSIRPRSRYAL